MKLPPHIEEAMKSVNSGGIKNKPVIMELVGEKGQKVGEYVDGKKKKKCKYYVLEESHTC